MNDKKQEPNSSETTLAERKNHYLRLVKFDDSPFMMEQILRVDVLWHRSPWHVFVYPDVVYWIYNNSLVEDERIPVWAIIELLDEFHDRKANHFIMPRGEPSKPPRQYHYSQRYDQSSLFD